MTPNDRVQSVLRSFTSSVDLVAPGVGSIFGELITVILPANREERLVQFASNLHREVQRLDRSLENVFASLSAEQIALLEDGMRDSARAAQSARIERIAYVVAEGFEGDSAAVRQREVLDMLGRLSDLDLITLARFFNWRGEDDFREPVLTTGTWNAMSDDEKAPILEERRLRELSLSKLLALGLLDQKYNASSLGYGSDEIKVESGELRLTALGHFFAEQLGIWPSKVATPSFR